MGLSPKECAQRLRETNFTQAYGKITKIVGLVAEGTGLNAPLGPVCHIIPDDGSEPVAAEVAGFRDGNLLFMPYENLRGVSPGSLIRNSSIPPVFPG